MSITTADIKNALNQKYGKQKWVRITKRKFKYDNAVIAPDFALDGDINWRAFISEEEGEPCFVFDDGQNILMTTDEPLIPADNFVYGLSPLSEDLDMLALFINFNDDFKDFPSDTDISRDNIREYYIAGLESHFIQNGFILQNEMENTFSITQIKSGVDFDTFESFEFEIKKIAAQLGIKHSTKLERLLYSGFGDHFNKEVFVKELDMEHLNKAIKQ